MNEVRATTIEVKKISECEKEALLWVGLEWKIS